MGRIIRFHGDEHRQAQLHMPWYVTGRLEPQEHARVEAHISACPECQSELEFERRLDAEIADLPVELEHGWRRMRERLTPRPPRRTLGGALGAWLAAGGTAWQTRTIAAQFALLLLLSAALLLPHLQPARYQALGAAPTTTAANLIVIFRPDTPEGTMRELLNATSARVVDGPTAAGVYVLSTPGAKRAAALARLRGRTEVVLAEPIDAGRSP